MPLGFGRSTFRFASTPGAYSGACDLSGLRVATSYTGLLGKYLADQGVDARVIKLDGAVETAIRLGVADAVADVVETGTTLRNVGLEVFGEPIARSEGILIKRAGAVEANGFQQLIRRLQGVLVARDFVMIDYDIRVERIDDEAAPIVPPGLHDHVVFEMSSGCAVTFNDPRRFGTMDLLPRQDDGGHATLPGLGPEPLADEFDAAALARACRGRTAPLKNTLLDQRVVAGLGNIYAVEALHRAGLSPRRRTSTIATPAGMPRPTAVRLVQAIKAVLRKAVERQLRPSPYRASRFAVYDREGEACPTRGCDGTVRRIVQAGRSTFYCPVCQR